MKKKIPSYNFSFLFFYCRCEVEISALSLFADYLPFFKDPSGRYIVLYTFIARDENDVSVERGEFVTVLNKEDPDWYWIVRTDGQEGEKTCLFLFYFFLKYIFFQQRFCSKRICLSS